MPAKKVTTLKDAECAPKSRRTRAKKQVEPDGKAEAGELAPEPVELNEFRTVATKELKARFRGIVGALAKEAQQGSLKHTEWLLEFSGVDFNEMANGELEKKVSLAELLLEEVARAKDAEDPLSPEKDRLNSGA